MNSVLQHAEHCCSAELLQINLKARSKQGAIGL